MKLPLTAPLCALAAALPGCAAQQPPATLNKQGDRALFAAKAAQTAAGAHDQRMGWWRDARFGLFIHWGVYSVPAGTWNGKTTGGPSEWLMESLHVPTSEYVKFAGGFTADKYDPAAWAALAKEAGMKYIVITSRHHDGFCLWDSAVSEWDVMASPAGRDLLKPLADATRAQGLHFCTYYSILDWRHPDYQPRRAWNDRPEWNGGPGYAADFKGRFVPYVHKQVEEVIRGVDPDVLWFDGEWEDSWTQDLGRSLYNRVRALKPSIIVNNRVGKSRNDMQGFSRTGVEPLGDFCTPEQEVPAAGLPGVDWETCMTMNDSWGFKASDHNWKGASQIVRTLCDVAAKGGNFLLNVGPTPDGAIPAESVERLRAVGRWMSLNGDAIYGTHASPFNKLSFGRATQKGLTLNLLVFDWPQSGDLALPGLSPLPASVHVAALDKMLRRVRVTQGKDGVQLSGLGPRPGGPGLADMPVLVRLQFDRPFTVVTPPPDPIARDALGEYTLTAGDAAVRGSSLRLQERGANENLGYWTNPADKAVWTIADLPAGAYRVEVELACQKSDAGSRFEISLNGATAGATVPSTGSWNTFTTVTLDGVRVQQPASPAAIEVRAAPGATLKGGLMNLRQLRLIRTN